MSGKEDPVYEYTRLYGNRFIGLNRSDLGGCHREVELDGEGKVIRAITVDAWPGSEAAFEVDKETLESLRHLPNKL